MSVNQLNIRGVCRCHASINFSALRHTSDAPVSRSAVTFRPSIVAGIKASSRFLTAAAVRKVNDRRRGIFIAATVSGISKLVSVEVSGKLVFTILVRSV